ncbi:MAG: class I SAM-dependent methyltransferase [Kofleriaceae bacterium]|nr:class I SAM-dependent methyltransferase [Kofleriaceae bacterium]
MVDRHGLLAAARAGGATLAITAATQVAAPSFVAPVAATCVAGVLAFELTRIGRRLLRSLAFLDADVSQVQAFVALNDRLVTRRPLPPMRDYAIAPDFGLALVQLIADERPQLVVETGSGVSTLIIAYLLEKLGRGRLISLEQEPTHAARTRAELERHGLSAFAQVVDAPLAPVIIDGVTYRWHSTRALDALSGIDLVVDDSPPRTLGANLRYASLPTFAPKLSPRGTFVMNYITSEELDVLARWKRELPEFRHELHATKKGHAILRRAPGGQVESAQL